LLTELKTPGIQIKDAYFFHIFDKSFTMISLLSTSTVIYLWCISYN